MKKVYVINLKGEEEPFSFQKVLRSARRAGASPQLAREIAGTIEKQVFNGIETAEIFKKVKRLLRQSIPEAAMRFSLKEGMRKLGPTGFAFEKYIGEIFFKKGFRVKLNREIRGLCCQYEIDFLAEDKKSIIIGECKYRNLPGGRIDLPVALQNYARFLDIKNGSFLEERENKEAKSLIVTNTKFTHEVIRYAKCTKTGLWGWSYPRGKGLERFIDEHKFYPITILPSFKKDLARVFVEKKMMLIEDVSGLDVKKFSRENGLAPSQLEPLVKEAQLLLS